MSDPGPIGLIVPPAAGEVPPEAAEMYPGVAFTAVGLGLREMSVAGYAGVVDRIGAEARGLAEAGAAAVALMGTSLSFFRGRAFNEELIAALREASGLPATTMAQAIVDALEAVGARRLAVGTAYEAEVNQLLAAYLAEHNLEVAGLASLDLHAVAGVAEIPSARIVALGCDALAAAGTADAVLISCGGLRTTAATAGLRRETGLPVVASATAGMWGAVRLRDARLAGPPAEVFGPVRDRPGSAGDGVEGVVRRAGDAEDTGR